jgi:molybdenum cofactor cytidylyltransferase
MKFARYPLAEAAGAILAHSLATPSGMIRKGRRLGADEIARLAASGHSAVVAARLEPGDVGEDEAAGRIASAATGDGARAAAPFTGRANVFAAAYGLAVIDAVAVAALNGIDEGLTIATLPAFERVAEGQMLATVKVITFALAERIVAEGERIARGAGGLVRVAPFMRKAAGLVLTRMPSTRSQVLAKRREAIAARLAALGSTLAHVGTVAHTEPAVAAAIQEMAARGLDPIIVFAASAIVDRGDVIPAALVEAGGSVLRLGMPVDPGNLMMLGRLGTCDVIGAPSCAASPKINGFDWVLERRLAGIEVSGSEVAAMGLGGLLKEIATRPQPREASEDDMDEGVRREPLIAALVLAAGRSTRFGAANKLTADVGGMAMVRRTVSNVLASRARPVVVVTGHEADAVTAVLEGLDVARVHNPDYAAGLSTSLKAGLAALPDGIGGVLVCLGDMPAVGAEHIDRLIAGFAPKEGRAIIVPVHQGKRGNPVLFAAGFIPEMRDAVGDSGARHVIGRYADAVAEVDLGTDAIFLDIDTQEALARLGRAR